MQHQKVDMSQKYQICHIPAQKLRKRTFSKKKVHLPRIKPLSMSLKQDDKKTYKYEIVLMLWPFRRLLLAWLPSPFSLLARFFRL